MPVSEPKPRYNEDETRSDKLHSDLESNSVYYIVIRLQKLLYRESNSPIERAVFADKLHSVLEGIFKSKPAGRTFIYLLERGACTGWLLQVHLNMPEATVYSALRRLRTLGVIVQGSKIRKTPGTPGGPRTTIWTLLGASEDDISRAVREHYRSLSPKYRVAEELVQTIMDEYIIKRNVDEITRREIDLFTWEIKTQFRKADISLIATNILREKGIKVWG